MEKIAEKYNALKKKYSLPEFSDLNRDFDLEDISPDSDILLYRIRARIFEKIDIYSKMFESMLQPDSSLADMYEAHYISDNDKNDAYSVFKKLMQILRKSNMVSLDNSEEKNAEFIKESFSEWESLKPRIKSHIKRLLQVWNKETDIKDDLSYFG